MMKQLILFLLLGVVFYSHGQNVYKTPSGKRYHLASCRMVENVSKKLDGRNEIIHYKLTPCKICKPPSIQNIKVGNSFSNKAVGQSSTVRCKGITKKGTRCKHMTKLANGYCFQHTSQNSSKKPVKYNYSSSNTTSLCGARTKSGGYCKRKVKGGGRCYQH